ncbi:MAG: DUF1592 domain-containing protein [Rhodospirillaceae bacterium]|nr:DUF1592 domain-containing protein [Rhodospirillaceae bacterium]
MKPTAIAASDAPTDGTARRLRLVTAEQYRNTLAYVFGPNITIPSAFAPVTRTDGLLGVGTSLAGVTASQMEIYQKTAATAAAQVVNESNRHFLVPCTPKDTAAPDDACARIFLSAVGRLVYRRPLAEERLVEYIAEANESATKLKDFYAGLGAALEGMLLSPRVLMVSERGEPDPDHPGHERLDGYSLASRLSFFLWNAGPDDLLLKAAASGELHTQKGLSKTLDRMLASPRLEAGMRAFFDDMFMFDDFNNLAKDGQIYPVFTGVAVQDAREQTLRTVIDHLLTKDRDYRDLFTTRSTFISPSLATIYRLPTTPGWSPYEFPADSPRMGLLTQISFLAGHAHPGRSSPTLRGKALREVLLCQTVPRPPANVDFSAVENPASTIKTQRERVALHLKNPVCAGCHKITDPMGLALENFDGAGQFRTEEKGSKIDASGSLDGKEFQDVTGLAAALHDHPQVPSCLVKRVFAYGTGSPASADEKSTLDYLNKNFAAGGYRLRNLLRTVVMSSAFSTVSSPTPEPAKSASVVHGSSGASPVKTDIKTDAQ